MARHGAGGGKGWQVDIAAGIWGGARAQRDACGASADITEPGLLLIRHPPRRAFVAARSLSVVYRRTFAVIRVIGASMGDITASSHPAVALFIAQALDARRETALTDDTNGAHDKTYRPGSGAYM